MGEVITTRETKIVKWGNSRVLTIDETDRLHLLGSDAPFEEGDYVVKKQLSRNKKGQNYIAFWIEKKEE